jgi:probable phosphoglycerate mutase
VTIYLVRHGQTASNRDSLGLGRDDLPLTRLGERQAAALATRMKDVPLERILSSPLGRAHQTALALAAGRAVGVEMRSELLELDVGETEGLTFPQMRERRRAPA